MILEIKLIDTRGEEEYLSAMILFSTRLFRTLMLWCINQLSSFTNRASSSRRKKEVGLQRRWIDFQEFGHKASKINGVAYVNVLYVCGSAFGCCSLGCKEFRYAAFLVCGVCWHVCKTGTVSLVSLENLVAFYKKRDHMVFGLFFL